MSELRSMDEFFRHELYSESDRASAIVGAAIIDDALTGALQICLIQDSGILRELFKPSGPIGATANKAKLAYTMGIINKDDLHDILIVCKVRNMCAHWANEAQFENKHIKSELFDLRFWPKELAKYDGKEGFASMFKQFPPRDPDIDLQFRWAFFISGIASHISSCKWQIKKGKKLSLPPEP